MSWRYKGDSLYTAFSNGQTEKPVKQNNNHNKHTPKPNGKIKYNKFESNCNLEYVVTATGVKENIILEKYTGKNRFSFEITANGLSFVKNEDKSISVFNQNGEEVFYIPAPFMFDSNNQYCYEVEYLVEHKKDKCIITVVADENWLKNSDTKYPVTIDPVIETQKSKSLIQTTFVTSKRPSANYNGVGDIYIGIETSAYGICRTLVEFEKLPTLKNSDMIVGATLGLWMYNTSFYLETMPDKQINVHAITKEWDIDSVNWSTQPDISLEVSDYNFIRKNENSYNTSYEKVFDVTRTVKEWYEGTMANNGFLIKSDVEEGEYSEMAARAIFYSDNNNPQNLMPYIAIKYRNNKGLEDYWSYSSYSIGTAGTAHVNDYTGNLVYELPILSSISERAPVSIVGYYNNYCASKLIGEKDIEAEDTETEETEDENRIGSVRTSIGRGFRLIYQQTVLPSSEYIENSDFNKKYPYVYTDGDGTAHYFVKKTEDGKTVYKDEDGLGLTLVTELDENESGTYKITDKAHNNYYFNKTGNLFRLKDNNDNEINIKYKNANSANDLPEQLRIDKIIDGAGHTYTFKYYVKSSTGVALDYVESITDNAGRKINFDISGGLLKNVSYPNGDDVDIEYETHTITKDEKEKKTETVNIIDYVQSNNSYRLGFYYTTAATGTRVKNVTEYGIISGGEVSKGQSVTFDRSRYNTTISRSSGVDGIHNDANPDYGDDDIITTVQFDNMGRAISQQMEFGSGAEIGAGSVGYTSSSDDSTASGFKNKISESGAAGKYVENLLLGGNAEEYGPWDYDEAGSVAGKKAISEASHYIGEKSIKLEIEKLAEDGRCFYKQDFDNVEKNTSYTLSAYAKTGDLELKSDADLTGAFIQIRGFDSNGNEVEGVNSRSQILTERSDLDVNNGWRRLSCTVETTSKVAFLRCYLVLRNVVGPVCFDGIQLEKGSTANDYNMLENSNFSYASSGVPTSWEGTTQFVFQSGVNGVVDPDDLPNSFNEGDSYYKDIISKAVRMTGTPGVEKGVCQYVPVEGNPNDTYILSGWAKGFPVNSTFHTTGSGDNKNEIATFEIAVKVIYLGSDGEKHAEFKTPASFNTTITDWQCASVPISLKSTEGEDGITYTPTEIKIIPRYHNQENFVFFDKIMLVKDSTSSYTYDSEGNLTGTRSSPEHKASMEYDDKDNLISYKDVAGYTTKLSYDSKNNLIQTESPKGVYYKDTNNTKDHIRTYDTRNASTIEDASGAIRTAVKYNDQPLPYGDDKTINAGSYLVGEYDENKNYTEYTRDTKTGVIKKVTNPEDVSTYYEYIRDYTVKKSVTVRNSKVVYSYDDKNRLEYIRFGEKDTESDTGVKDYERYQFKYDEFGNVIETYVGNQYLSKNTFDTHNGPLIKTQFGNGDELRYEYNKFGQKRKELGTEYGKEERTLYSYIYNSSGELQYISDKKNDIRTILDYDSLGRLSKTEIANDNNLSYIGSTEYDYDKRGNVSKIVTNYGGVSHTQKYLYGTTSLNDNSESYKKDGLASAYQLYSSRYAMYEYDSLNRFTQRKLTLDKPLYYNYTFVSSDRNEDGGNKFRTTQVGKEFIGKNVFLYQYDKLGNITSIRKAQRTGSGSSTEFGDTSAYRTYEYDDLGQLVRENNKTDDKTYTYQYDKLGNIENKKVYDFTTESVDGEASELLIDYNYEQLENSKGEKSWENALVSVDLNGSGKITSDETISYDRIGNPTTYLGATLTWFGRQLTSYTKGDTEVSYKYNADGLRTEKIVDGVKREYVYIGDQLHYEKRGSKNIFYFYDCNGYLTGLEYDGTTYYPATTLNGDVVAIYDHNGTCLVEYEYDAWGNCEIKDDKSGFNLANINPIRYRGYYYDRETGLYYLQSRYYDPSIGRFINADDEVPDIGGDVLGNNMFSYCQNNPVNMSDPTGHWPSWSKLFGGASIALGGMSAIAAVAVGSLACLNPVVLTAVVVAGAVSVAMGSSEIVESFTGHNTVRDDVLQGNTQAYEVVRTVSSTVTAAANLVSSITTVCFVAGTWILTNNMLIEIEKIEVGDKVWAENPETGQKELKSVVRTFENESSELVHIFVNGEEIITTPTHPFYVPEKGWTDAVKLRAGDILVLRNGDYVIIEKVQHEILETPIKVYNFEVEDFHTYYVGSSSILVHNACGPKNQETYSTRRQAFNASKRDIGVPTSQQPVKVGPNIDKRGNIVPGRLYDFGNGKYVRDDVVGHIFKDGGSIGRHFNNSNETIHFFYE